MRTERERFGSSGQLRAQQLFGQKCAFSGFCLAAHAASESVVRDAVGGGKGTGNQPSPFLPLLSNELISLRRATTLCRACKP